MKTKTKTKKNKNNIIKNLKKNKKKKNYKNKKFKKKYQSGGAPAYSGETDAEKGVAIAGTVIGAGAAAYGLYYALGALGKRAWRRFFTRSSGAATSAGVQAAAEAASGAAAVPMAGANTGTETSCNLLDGTVRGVGQAGIYAGILAGAGDVIGSMASAEALNINSGQQAKNLKKGEYESNEVSSDSNTNTGYSINASLHHPTYGLTSSGEDEAYKGGDLQTGGYKNKEKQRKTKKNKEKQRKTKKNKEKKRKKYSK